MAIARGNAAMGHVHRLGVHPTIVQGHAHKESSSCINTRSDLQACGARLNRLHLLAAACKSVMQLLKASI
jgi:hypothetical protein